MNESSPRKIVRDLLQGVRPARPLFLPIVFSLGAKTEDLPLWTFLGNATKISNSLRQIRAHTRSDGFSCYFDPYLEVEAFGATLEWDVTGGPPSVLWPEGSVQGELPRDLRSPEDAVNRGRIGVAIDVIRRLKAMQRDDVVLAAGVSGPLTLAARLTQLNLDSSIKSDQIPEEALDSAASVTLLVASAFAEAGANLIFIQEEVLPLFDVEGCESWASLLAPTLNRARFYESLPVLHFDAGSFARNSAVILERYRDSVVCIPLASDSGENRYRPIDLLTVSGPATPMLGISLPLSDVTPDDRRDAAFESMVEQSVSDLHPVIITTRGDVSSETDVKRLVGISERQRAAGSGLSSDSTMG